MPGFLAIAFSNTEAVTLGLVVVLAALGTLLGIRAWRNSRPTPAERERRRRHALASLGKMGDANLVDLRDNLVFYSYDVRGVEYTASQDVSELQNLLPPDLSSAVGAIYVKYDARNPANSIVLAEEWSGLRTASPQP
jgi:hypothetical protein